MDVGGELWDVVTETGWVGERLLDVFRLLRLLHILCWILVVCCIVPRTVCNSPSTLWIFVLAHLKDASVCDRLPSRVRTELDEDAADIFVT